MDLETARERILEVAEPLFCSRGITAVRMEEVRDASGVSLRRLYQLFPAKEDLAIACLRARDGAQHDRLEAFLAGESDPTARLLGVFDFLAIWFADPDFTGCAWINSWGELGHSSPRIAADVREHKAGFRRMLGTMCEQARLAGEVADSLMVLAEGAIVCAAIQGRPDPALHARAAVEAIISAARHTPVGA